ncbi:MAG TPA: hypothetical protein DEP18_02620, partial [Flavobacteriales bacterium]|nr:hypothetical protein [Flavobacteriales bacterium]
FGMTIHADRAAYSSMQNIMNGHAKVKTFEHNWKEIAGLWVQVFRKSGNVWLQTTVTDDLSLADVNRFGEEMAKDVEKDALPDIHEQE